MNLSNFVRNLICVLCLSCLFVQSVQADTLGFTGESQDSNAVFLRARYYDPETGTFLTKDPLGVSGGVNQYVYAGGNPVNCTDQNGQFFWIAIGAGVGALVGGVVEWHRGGNIYQVMGAVGAGALGGAALASGAALLAAAYETATISTTTYVAANGLVGAADAAGTNITTQVWTSPDPLAPNPINIQQLAASTAVGGFLGLGSGGVSVVFGELTQASGPANLAAEQGQLSALQLTLNELSGGIGGPAVTDNPLLTFAQSEVSNAQSAANVTSIVTLSGVGGEHFISDILDPAAEPTLDSVFEPSENDSSGSNSTLDSNSNIPFIPAADGTTDMPDFGNLTFDMSDPDVGGVLIDKAATLVGSNLSDIKGVTYDPTTKQLIFLGSNNKPSSTLPGINMDYFYTAIQAVYGSATPPYVSLYNPVNGFPTWVNFTNAPDGMVLKQSETGGFTINYTPYWPQVDNQIVVHLKAHDTNNKLYDLNFNFSANYATTFKLPGSTTASPMLLYFTGATSNNSNPVPTNLTLDNSPFTQSSLLTSPPEPTFNPVQLSQYENVNYPFRINNNTGVNLTIDNVYIIPDQQHRIYGGRVDATKLGWVMFEADRLMKCLTIGKDDLTGISYSSTSGTVNVPGYKNLLELGTATTFSRFWFEPNQMTLQSYVDPTSGAATVGFSTATVELLTESQLLGQPSPTGATTFATFFNNNYNAFAAQNFTVVDPNDPTGQGRLSLPIFSLLRQAMQAVSLARFFHDNNIPLDKWWMSSYTPPTAFTLKSVPTAFNTSGSGSSVVLVYGGVQIDKLNTYTPSANAQALATNVIGARPAPLPTDPQDLPAQMWSASDPTQGSLTAVAASLTTDHQDGNVNLNETDLDFASPGELPLKFARHYQSSYVGPGNLGAGWSDVPYTLQFSSPSWWDQNHTLSNGPGGPIATASNGDTHLRSGTIRVVSLSRGAYLDFQSSAQLVNGVDSLGNPTSFISNLTSGNLPTFAAGIHANGATLLQNGDGTFDYAASLPDGSKLLFDPNGNLLQTTDRHGQSKTYGYDSQGRLATISDSVSPTPQVITLSYDPTLGMLSEASGPSDSTSYQYDTSSRLAKVIHTAVDPNTGQPVNVVMAQYSYNTENQLVSVTRMDGTTPIITTADVKGRSSTRLNSRGNMTTFTYTVDGSGNRTTSASVANSGLTPAVKKTDAMGRTTAVTDGLGNTTGFVYNNSSYLPNSVQLPTHGRPAIQILRNSFGQPTTFTDPAVVGAQPIQVSYNPGTNMPNQISDMAGRVTKFIYTTAHNNLQTLRQTHNGANVDFGFGFDASDNLQTMTNPLNKNWTFGRDTQGRVTSLKDPTGVTVSCTYDSNGNVATVTDPRLSSNLIYKYDSLHRPTSLTTPMGTKSFVYDPVTQWLDSTTQKDTGGNILQTISYTYNNSNGQVTGATASLSQPGVTGSTMVTTTYGYDNYGNLTSVTPPGAQPINYNVNSAGQLLGTTETAVGPAVGPTIIASNASSGVWTTQSSQTMSWGAPQSSLPISGYSFAEDGSAGTVVNVTGTSLAWNNISDGQHLFTMRAVDSAGNWSPQSVFNMWVDSTPPSISIVGVTPTPLPQGSVTVTAIANVSDGGSGLAGVPQTRWCVSSDATRPWSSYASMNAGTGSQWSGSFVEPGNGQNLYYQIQAQDTAGNIGTFTGTMSISGPGGTDGPLMPPLALALLALLFFGVGNWLLNGKVKSEYSHK